MHTKQLLHLLEIHRLAVRHPLTDVTLFGRVKAGRMVLCGVAFGRRSLYGKRRCAVSPHPELIRCGRKIQGFLDGRVKDLSALPLDFSGMLPFSKKLLTAARKIPWGKTVSYARLAAMAGNPKAVRAAASAMRNNPFPLVVPCHRVIRSDCAVGGFMGKTRGREVALKFQLIKRERPAP